jgi:8-oxo-dGTP pyrophosphatase MutT (NUDIX family)
MLNLGCLEETLGPILTKREPRRINDNAALYTQASILLPLFRKDAHFWTLFIKRATTVEYHKGEISFPGGVVDQSDNSPEHTAKRETFEEIGVREEDITILGQLDDVTTVTSGFIIHPFVGLLPFPYVFNVNKQEVEDLIEIPLQFFFDPSQPRSFTINNEGDSFETPAFIYKENVIWGATQRILENFITLIRFAI